MSKLDETRSLTAEDLELIVGGLIGNPTGIIKPPADPADTTCGTKGPGPYVPVLSRS